MTIGHALRRTRSPHPSGAHRPWREENFFFAMVGCSLLVHVIVAVIFQSHPAPSALHKPPTITVDLVMAPVANPQRGRAGRMSRPVLPLPVVTPLEPAVTTKVTAKEVVVVKEQGEEDNINNWIAAKRRRLAEQAERQEVQDAIAAMGKKRTTAPQALAASGSPSGTGDEAGSAIAEWLQVAVKKKWRWPDRKRKDLSAEVKIEFDTSGKLIKCEVFKPSSDPRFDASLERAIRSVEPLPKALNKPFKETILFNLEDLQQP